MSYLYITMLLKTLLLCKNAFLRVFTAQSISAYFIHSSKQSIVRNLEKLICLTVLVE